MSIDYFSVYNTLINDLQNQHEHNNDYLNRNIYNNRDNENYIKINKKDLEYILLDFNDYIRQSIQAIKSLQVEILNLNETIEDFSKNNQVNRQFNNKETLDLPYDYQHERLNTSGLAYNYDAYLSSHNENIGSFSTNSNFKNEKEIKESRPSDNIGTYFDYSRPFSSIAFSDDNNPYIETIQDIERIDPQNTQNSQEAHYNERVHHHDDDDYRDDHKYTPSHFNKNDLNYNYDHRVNEKDQESIIKEEIDKKEEEEILKHKQENEEVHKKTEESLQELSSFSNNKPLSLREKIKIASKNKQEESINKSIQDNNSHGEIKTVLTNQILKKITFIDSFQAYFANKYASNSYKDFLGYLVEYKFEIPTLLEILSDMEKGEKNPLSFSEESFSNFIQRTRGNNFNSQNEPNITKTPIIFEEEEEENINSSSKTNENRNSSIDKRKKMPRSVYKSIEPIEKRTFENNLRKYEDRPVNQHAKPFIRFTRTNGTYFDKKIKERSLSPPINNRIKTNE